VNKHTTTDHHAGRSTALCSQAAKCSTPAALNPSKPTVSQNATPRPLSIPAHQFTLRTTRCCALARQCAQRTSPCHPCSRCGDRLLLRPRASLGLHLSVPRRHHCNRCAQDLRAQEACAAPASAVATHNAFLRLLRSSAASARPLVYTVTPLTRPAANCYDRQLLRPTQLPATLDRLLQRKAASLHTYKCGSQHWRWTQKHDAYLIPIRLHSP
jgi:hypothetical protein